MSWLESWWRRGVAERGRYIYPIPSDGAGFLMTLIVLGKLGLMVPRYGVLDGK